MSRFAVLQIDHVHVSVADRAAAAAWYETVLGLECDQQFASWAADRHGPLILKTPEGQTALSLFERPGGPHPGAGTIAFRVGAADFMTLVRSLDGSLKNARGLPLDAGSVVDHHLSLSIYFTDPDSNPIEITTYERSEAMRTLHYLAALSE